MEENHPKAFVRTEDLNVASGEVINPDEYTIRATMNLANGIAKNRGKAKNRMNTFTIGSNSDVSTTVMAPSVAAHRVRKNTSLGAANFAELGTALINDTPRSKLSMD